MLFRSYIDEKYFSGKAGAESHIQRLHFDITPSLDILLEPIAQGNCDMLGSQRGHLSPLAASARFNSVVSGPISFGADPCRRISSAPASRNRSEESRVGKACVSTCSSRWSPSH